MTCSEVERVLPELLDGAPDGVRGTFHADFDAHVKSCPACSDLVSDLKLIASEAGRLAASEEPAPRVWVRIAAQLRAEGLIREPAESLARPACCSSLRVEGAGWSAWWLAPVAAALLAAGAYVVSHKPPASGATATVSPTPVNAPVPVVAEPPRLSRPTRSSCDSSCGNPPPAAPAGQEVAR
jgi:predicted anti-sigma-YlaC factor YlaD